MDNYSIRKNLESDVVVIGGGTAGVFAAISSAMCGAKTLLIEKNSMLGGTVTVANVNYPGLFFAWGKQIISGPCFEAIKRTAELGGAKIPVIQFKPEHHWDEQIKLNRFIYTAVITQMCVESGVYLVLNSMISDIIEHENGVKILFTDKEGLCEIRCKNVIDTSGDATAVALAGYNTVKSIKQQPATLQNTISGYNKNKDYTAYITKNMSNFDLPDYITAEKLQSYLKTGEINYHILSVDAHTSYGKTQVEINALKLLLDIYKLFHTIPGLEDLRIDFIAEETGIRETVRIIGEETVTKDDYLAGRLYKDSVCYSFYPVDLHVDEGYINNFLAENVVPKIPFGALIPKDSKHIIAAGRCISSDVLANSAIRVQATCMATGQVAGCAVALACKNNILIRNIDYDLLCRQLEKIGAIIPKE